MLLPLTAWAVTGAIFFIKPGYGGAYESLAVRTYPLTAPQTVTPSDDWREVRTLRSVLGTHLLARTADGWHQFDVATMQPRPSPTAAEVRSLIEDAISVNADRYGTIDAIDGMRATTSTGARVTLDWNRMALSQRGLDTDRIDAIYRVHYLQWTGVASVDRVLGAVGLLLLVALSAAGVRLLVRRRAQS